MTYEQTYDAPSLEFFQEFLWDATENWDMSDDEVRDLGIWTGHKFLGYSRRKLAKSWDMTPGAVESVVKRLDRFMEKQGEEQKDLLAQATALCHLAGIAKLAPLFVEN